MGYYFTTFSVAWMADPNTIRVNLNSTRHDVYADYSHYYAHSTNSCDPTAGLISPGMWGGVGDSKGGGGNLTTA